MKNVSHGDIQRIVIKSFLYYVDNKDNNYRIAIDMIAA